MIDLKNTWCEATEETYAKLISLYPDCGKFYSIEQALTFDAFIIKNNSFSLNSNRMSDLRGDAKQIHLVNGEFQYVVTKHKNNFKDYGFEADFEGEICFENINGFLIGYVNKPVGKIIKQWRKIDGQCFDMEGYIIEDYILKPIKKEWYENPDNFPCIVISLKTNKPHITYNYNHLEEKIKQETFSAKPDKFRPATKEEVLSLLIKED